MTVSHVMKINKPLKFQKEAAIRPTTDNYLIFNFYSLLRITTYLYFIYIYRFVWIPLSQHFVADSSIFSILHRSHDRYEGWFRDDKLGRRKAFWSKEDGGWRNDSEVMTMVNGVSRTTYMPKSIERIEDGGWSQELEEWTLAQTASVGIREWFWFPRHFHARSFPSLAAYRQKTSPRLAFFFSSINRENHSIPPSVFIYP